LRSDTSVTEAARLVLGTRLRIVRDRLSRAVFDSEHNPEYVHQLRVATRRADAALRIFRSCLPKRIYRKTRKRLRALRQAAGAARDWDVFLHALVKRQGTAPAEELPGLDFLMGYALGQRHVAQITLQAVDQEERQVFVGLVHTVVERVRPPRKSRDDMPLISLARPLLRRGLADFQQAFAGDLTDHEHLHQVRITGKKLRYAMEVFATCFPPSFREGIYPLVEEVQEILGRANDSYVAAGRLTALSEELPQRLPAVWERLRGGIEGLLHFHQERMPKERERFLTWRQEWAEARVERIFEEQTQGAD